MTGWHELRIEVGRDDADAWSDALLDAGALSVQAEDADADSPDEQPLYGEPGALVPLAGEPSAWRRTVLAALVDADRDPRALLARAAGTLGRSAPPVRALGFVADRDWVRATQAQFEPIPIGERLLVRPSWHDDADGGDRLVLVLDPGLAFGTGTHPTTRLCLAWLERHLRPGDTVVDYGCGSGILAIAAARLGAADVTAIDIDPQALVATRENARRNRVVLRVQPTDAPPPAPADVVVANILSSPLKLLAPVLAALVRPGGSLVLSGVLERQVDEVAAAYDAWLTLRAVAAEDGWACLAGTKPR
jgi:ribosomal protein L11 methyltransferase